MSDICMCTGNCEMKESCLRYKKELNPYGQTFSSLESVCVPNNYSEYIPYEDNKKTISFTLNDFIMHEIRKSRSKTN